MKDSYGTYDGRFPEPPYVTENDMTEIKEAFRKIMDRSPFDSMTGDCYWCNSNQDDARGQHEHDCPWIQAYLILNS